MKKVKKIVALMVILSFVACAAPAFASEYTDNMQSAMVRGVKNVLGSPLEIPITIQEYHEGEGRPVVRHIAGAVNGTFQGLVRLGSGMWDLSLIHI